MVAEDRVAKLTNVFGALCVGVAVAVSGNTVFVASAGTTDASYADGKILRLTITP